MPYQTTETKDIPDTQFIDLNSFYEHWLLFSGKVVLFALALVLLYGLMKWKWFDKILKIYWVYLFLWFLLDFAEPLFVWSVRQYPGYWKPVLVQLDITTTTFLRYPFQVLNFTLLGWFLYRLLAPKPAAQVVKWVSITFLLTTTVNYFFLKGYTMATGYNYTVNAVFCFALPLLSMWFVYSESQRVILSHNPYFWINLGLILPNILSFLLSFIGNILFEENYPLFAQIAISKNIVEIVAQGLTAIGFYYARNARFI